MEKQSTPSERRAGDGADPQAYQEEQPITVKALLDHIEKLGGLAIGIGTSVFIMADDVFLISFWLLMILGGGVFVWYSWKKFTWQKAARFAVTVLLLAVISYGIHDFVTQPRFTIRVTGSSQTITTQRILWFTTPFFAQAEPFEITDNLIRAKDLVTLTRADRERLKQESIDKNETPSALPAFTDVLHLSINPQYKGTKPIQKVALRITGKNKDYSTTKTIWEHIEAASPLGEVDVTLPELIEASQIRYIDEDPLTNQNLGEHSFPESEITLEIIDEMHPEKPLSSPIHVKIQNSPWLQSASLARRDDGVYVDYALENLGKDGDFHYQLFITKITRDVEVSEHPVWSGTTLIHSETNKEKIALKPGASYHKSIRIKDLPRGRYVVSIFTIKHQDRVQFDAPASWDGFTNDYIYANPGNVFLLVDCNDPGKTCSDSDVFPVEQGNVYTETFQGSDENMGGLARLKYVTAHPLPDENSRVSNIYALEYSVDPQSSGYAGLSLVFDQPKDLSAYSSVRMNIQLSQEKSPMMVRLTSRKGQDQKQYEVIIGDGTYGENATGEQTIEIPLSLYRDPGVDMTSIAFISFVAHEEYQSSDRNQIFRVGRIEFIR